MLKSHQDERESVAAEIAQLKERTMRLEAELVHARQSLLWQSTQRPPPAGGQAPTLQLRKHVSMRKEGF